MQKHNVFIYDICIICIFVIKLKCQLCICAFALCRKYCA